MKIGQDFVPNGCSPRYPGNITHAQALAVSDPDAHGVIRRPSDRPVITHIFAGSRFHSGPEAGGKDAFQPEPCRSRDAIRQNIAYHPACHWIDNLPILPRDFAWRKYPYRVAPSPLL